MRKMFLPTLMLVFSSVFIAACGGATEGKTAAEDSTSVAKVDTIVYEHDYLVKVGDVAPDFALPMTDGSTFKLSDHRGKVVMLQFTASWCGVCRKEMPHIESQIWQRHKENADFVLVGVDREETKDVVDAYTQKVGTTYPMALDTAANVFASYALRQSGITRNVLINRDGTIVKLTRLYNEDEFSSLVQSIDSLLAK
jgi:peroxiredoxin